LIKKVIIYPVNGLNFPVKGKIATLMYKKIKTAGGLDGRIEKGLHNTATFAVSLAI